MRQIYIYILIVLGVIFNYNVSAQAKVNVSGAKPIVGAGMYLIVPSSVTIASNSSIINNGSILLGGDFINNANGLDASGIGTVNFNGSSTQNINGINSTTFYDVTKSTNTSVVIGLNEIVNHTLTLTTGFFNLNSQNLILNGAFSGSGKLIGSLSSGLIIGGSAGTINFDQTGTNNYLDTLTVNSLGNIAIGNALNIAAGSFTNPGTVTASGILDANGLLTLKSDTNGTARVAISTGKINSEVTVERFIPQRRAWRFLSAPFSSSSQTINAAWQEGQTNTNPYNCPTGDPAPSGYGTEITYNNTAGTGYDYNLTTNPSLKIWSSTSNVWTTPANTNSTNIASPYSAYCLFVRGDRQVCLVNGIYAPVNNTTLRAKGTLTQNNGATVSRLMGTYNNGDFIFVGNPYASTVNLLGVLNNSANINQNTFWAWDPGAPGSSNVGAYVTYNVGTGISVPSGSTYSGGQYAQSGQAFFVQSTGGNASINFNETDKVVSETNVYNRMAKPVPVIYTNLMTPSGTGLILDDGVGIAFGNRYSALVDGEDASKQWNFDENIALYRDTKYLAIELRPVPQLTDTLFYRLYLRQQPYTLQVFSQNLPGNNMPARAWLVDNYLKTKTEINLYDTTLYNFTPNADTMSYRNRFMLVFNRQLQTTPVPVTKATNQADPNITGIANNNVLEKGSISIAPNPVTTAKNALLRFSNMAKGMYEITVYNAKGQKLGSEKIQHDGSNTVYHLPSNTSWSAGVYSIDILNQVTRELANLKLIVSK